MNQKKEEADKKTHELSALHGSIESCFQALASSSVRLIPYIPKVKDDEQNTTLRESVNEMQMMARNNSSEQVGETVNISLNTIQGTFINLVDFIGKRNDVHKAKVNKYKEKETELKKEIKNLKQQYEDEKNSSPFMISKSVQSIPSRNKSKSTQADPPSLYK